MNKHELQVALDRSQRKIDYLERILMEIAGERPCSTPEQMAEALGCCQGKATAALRLGDAYAYGSAPGAAA